MENLFVPRLIFPKIEFIPSSTMDVNKQLEFYVNLNEIKDLNYHEDAHLPAQTFQDMNFVLWIYRKFNNANKSDWIGARLQVIIPDSCKKATIRYDITCPPLSNKKLVPLTLARGLEHHFTHDIDTRIGIRLSTGSGPFDRIRNNITINQIKPKYLNEKGEFCFMVSITRIKTKIDISHFIWKLKEFLLPPEETELEGLRSEVDYLEKLDKKLDQDIENQEKILPKILVLIEEEEQLNQELANSGNKLADENRSERMKIQQNQDRVMALIKKLETRNADEFLREFDETQVDFADFAVNEIKDLMVRILKLQSRISVKIIEEELCAICMENRRSISLQPCGHLYLCEDCSCQCLKSLGPNCPICQKEYSNTVLVKF